MQEHDLPMFIGMRKRRDALEFFRGPFPGCDCRNCRKNSRVAKIGKRNKKQTKWKA